MICHWNTEFNTFQEHILETGLQIVCYGAGLVALSLVHIFEDTGLLEHICCFVDNDAIKRGANFSFSRIDVPIISINDLRALDLSAKVLLITVEVFGAVIEHLDQYTEFDNLNCYIFAELNQSYIRNKQIKDIKEAGAAKIPKVIHYCWLGGQEMSQDMIDCMNTWKVKNPDYELVRWDENNYDIYQNPYMRQSYEAKKYAFTADYLRLDVIYRHGGIYLDTDVLCLKSFNTLLHNDAFAVYLEWAVPTFGISASVAGLSIIRQMRDEPRAELDFINKDGSYNQKISSYYETDVLRKYGFRQDFSFQNIEGLAIYPPKYFATYSRLGYNYDITDKTYAVHMLQRTWADDKRRTEINQTDNYIRKLNSEMSRSIEL